MGVKISQLPAGVQPTGPEAFEGVQDGRSVQLLASQILAYVQANIASSGYVIADVVTDANATAAIGTLTRLAVTNGTARTITVPHSDPANAGKSLVVIAQISSGGGGEIDIVCSGLDVFYGGTGTIAFNEGGAAQGSMTLVDNGDGTWSIAAYSLRT